MKKITIKEIANIAGKSPKTVSRVINNEKYVKKETKEKVIKVINELGYEPNFFARGLRTKRSKTIGLIIGDIENPCYAKLSKGVINVAEKADYNVIVCNSNYNAKLGERYISMLMQKGVDGLIIATINLTKKSIKKINKKNIPLVLTDCKLDLPDENYFIADEYYGGTLAAEYLISLGHKKIYFLRTANVYSANERVRAFKDTLKKYNIYFNKDYISKIIVTEEESYKETRIFLENKNGFTALVAGNDFIAMGAIRAIIEANLKIPDDISIIGYDDLEITPILKVPLTTIKQPKLLFGELSAKRLIEMLNNQESMKKPKQVVIKPEIIIRKSCKKII